MKTLIVLIIFGLIAFAAYQAYQAHKAEEAEARTLKSLPSTVRHVVAQMDATSQTSFFNEYESKKRRRSLSYLVWLICGAHYLYLRKNATQFVFWLTWLTIFVGPIWWLLDLFRMPGLVRTANEQVAREALQTLHVGAVFSQLNQQTPTDMLTKQVAGEDVPPPAPPSVAASTTEALPAPEGGAPQWSTDPTGRHESRYWDGTTWTRHVSNAAEVDSDPV